MIHETPRKGGRHDSPEGTRETRRREETPELVKIRDAERGHRQRPSMKQSSPRGR